MASDSYKVEKRGDGIWCLLRLNKGRWWEVYDQYKSQTSAIMALHDLTKPKTDNDTIKLVPKNPLWLIRTSHFDQLTQILDEDWEPWAIHNGLVYFKKLAKPIY